MRSLCFTFLLFFTPVAEASEELSKAPVGIYFQYESPPGENIASLIQNDAEAILSPLGFDLQWRALKPMDDEVWSDLAFVSFRGRCSAGLPELRRFQPGALGWTQSVNGEIQPFVAIDCNRVAALLQSQGTSLPARSSDRLFARAVARVLAHELYHVFGKTKLHNASGIGKAEFTARDLVLDDFEFDPGQARTLRKKSVENIRKLNLSGP